MNIKVNQRGAKKAETEQKKLGTAVAATIGKYIAMGVTVRAVGGFLVDSVKLYMRQELAEKKLQAALGYTSKALLNQASALQKMTMYGDENIIEAQALIGAFVKEESQIKAATKATLDLAAAKGMDLLTAADLVSKTLGSSTNAMSRYGIAVEGAVGSVKRLTSLTGNVDKAFGGQAAAQTKTMAGQVSQLANAWDDVKENVGELFILMAGLRRTDEKGWLLTATENVGEFFEDLAVEYATTTGQGEKHYSSLMELEKRRAEYHTKMYNAISKEDQKYWTQMYNYIVEMINEGKYIEAQKEKEVDLSKKLTEEQKRYNAFKKGQLKSQADAIEQEKFALKLWKEQNRELLKSKAIITSTPSDMVLSITLPEISESMERIQQAAKIDLEFDMTKADSDIARIAQSITAKYQAIANITQSTLGDSLIYAFNDGEDAAQHFVDNLKDMLIKLAAEMLVYGILRTFMGAEFGASVGGLAGFLGFGGGRAGGGPVVPGKYYAVNENTPNSEYFTPSVPGQIVPSVGTTINLSFNGNITDSSYVERFIVPAIKKSVRLGRV